MAGNGPSGFIPPSIPAMGLMNTYPYGSPSTPNPGARERMWNTPSAKAGHAPGQDRSIPTVSSVRLLRGPHLPNWGLL